MKVLIIGAGGREHALGWKIKQSPKVKELYFAPGNGGTSLIGENINIDSGDIKSLCKWAKQNAIDLTIVGPEAPLAKGIVDVFEKSQLKIFGPSKRAALLETSKSWAVKFMQRHNIPHPGSRIYTDAQKAKIFIRSRPDCQLVIKADGLAGGKGVVVPSSTPEALQAIDQIMVDKKFGKAGEKIVLQEKISGPEVSILAFTDGKTIRSLLAAQDHKQIYDGGKGPNTGGIGAYAPVSFVTSKLMKKISLEILQPTIAGLEEEGVLYKGVLYAGLMIATQGPKVIEYNVRFGDPEIQPLLMLLKGDLVPILLACIEENLQDIPVKFKKGSAVCVVLAANGYPGPYKKNLPIYGFNKTFDSTVQVFHSGTRWQENELVTNGGRVLGITVQKENLKASLRKVYSLIGKTGIHFAKMHYRKDIGKQNTL